MHESRRFEPRWLHSQYDCFFLLLFSITPLSLPAKFYHCFILLSDPLTVLSAKNCRILLLIPHPSHPSTFIALDVDWFLLISIAEAFSYTLRSLSVCFLSIVSSSSLFLALPLSSSLLLAVHVYFICIQWAKSIGSLRFASFPIDLPMSHHKNKKNYEKNYDNR